MTMMMLYKDRSLLLAEAVVQMLMIQLGDGSDERDAELMIAAAEMGGQSALRISEDIAGRVVWIFSRRVGGGIRVILGDRTRRSYDFDHVAKPNQDSEEYDFSEEEVYQAARSIFDFFR